MELWGPGFVCIHWVKICKLTDKQWSEIRIIKTALMFIKWSHCSTCKKVKSWREKWFTEWHPFAERSLLCCQPQWPSGINGPGHFSTAQNHVPFPCHRFWFSSTWYLLLPLKKWFYHRSIHRAKSSHADPEVVFFYAKMPCSHPISPGLGVQYIGTHNFLLMWAFCWKCSREQ